MKGYSETKRESEERFETGRSVLDEEAHYFQGGMAAVVDSYLASTAMLIFPLVFPFLFILAISHYNSCQKTWRHSGYREKEKSSQAISICRWLVVVFLVPRVIVISAASDNKWLWILLEIRVAVAQIWLCFVLFSFPADRVFHSSSKSLAAH